MFYAISLILVFIVHLYVAKGVSSYLNVEQLISNLTLLGLSLIFPLVIILDKIFFNRATKYLYVSVMVWVGALSILTALFMILDILKLFGFTIFFGGYLTIILALGIVLWSLLNPTLIKTKKYSIKLGLKKPITLVQLSDIHLGTINTEFFLKRIINKVNDLNPDYTVITGDLIDGSGLVTKKTTAPLKNLKSKSFFVTGNHENYFGVKKALSLIKGPKILRNEIVDLKEIQIAGVDNPLDEFSKKYDKIVILSKKVKKNKPAILLLHTPMGTNDFKNSNFDLMLSGHTHKGQIFPFGLLVKVFYKHLYGLYKEGSKKIIVSSGVGTW